MDKFLISIFAIIITVSEACLFKLKMKETKYPNMIGPWNELQNLKRTTITNCGMHLKFSLCIRFITELGFM